MVVALAYAISTGVKVAVRALVGGNLYFTFNGTTIALEMAVGGQSASRGI
jgi:hypothetical protein